MNNSEEIPGISSRTKQCCSRRTNLEGFLMIIVAVFILLGLGLTAILIKIHLKPEADEDICNTKGCVKAAAAMIKRMNDEVDPCDDFFQFSCGGFLKTTVIPDDKSKVNMFSIYEDKLDEQVRSLLEIPISKTEPRPFQLVKTFYWSCMNKSIIETKGVQTLQTILHKLGGWPVIQGRNWDSSKFSWYDSIVNYRKHGFSVDYFVDFSVYSNVRNSSYRILTLDQPFLGLRREYFMEGLGTSEVDAYHKFQVETAVLLGSERSWAEREMKAALEFERKLASISLPKEERRNSSRMYNPMTIAELQEKYNFGRLDWLNLIRKLMPENVGIQKLQVIVNADEVVNVVVPEYFEKFAKLIAQTDKRIQANYVLWRAVKASVEYLGEAYRKLEVDFDTALTGKGQKPLRWKECTNEVMSSLPHAVGALYAKKFFKEEARTSMLEMVADVRKAFLNTLKTVDWMDEKTRERAVDKATKMVEHIGYPVELTDNALLDKLYSKLQLHEDTYLENDLNVSILDTDREFSKLHEKVNKTDWLSHGQPAVVNAFYNWVENSIQFPAGILQGVFFENDRPSYLNYGAIGGVIGHEVTHGFDDQGRQYDANGNLNDWWEASTAESYLKRTQCIVSQYGNYTMSQVNLKLNGINTQGENTADNGGHNTAYQAYQSWVERNGPERKLPGINYTPNQLFWIGAAHVECSKFRPEALKEQILTDPHSPGEFIVIGSFSNNEQFSKDFNCPLNSRMNPPKKCVVW